jgi:type IV pilus assembly protein PilA
MSPATSRGFTLIELMIVVAIIAIVAAIALPAYEQYLREARMGKVIAHYDRAIRIVHAEIAKNAAIQARGEISPLPTNNAGWITIINPENRATTPIGGRPAYGETADSETGRIGIAYDAGNHEITVTRPSHLGLGVETFTKQTIDVH